MVIKQKQRRLLLKVKCDNEGIIKATYIITEGGIAVFPTDTVYGIGCNPFNRKAVEKVYAIKSRHKSKPFPILTFSLELAEKIAEFDTYSRQLAKKFWPGPLTILVKLRDKDLQQSLGLTDKIGLRVPNHSCTLELLKRCQFLVGTSANKSGKDSFVDPNRCMESIDGFDVFVDGGKINSDSESTIIEIINNKIKVIRRGVLTEKELKIE